MLLKLVLWAQDRLGDKARFPRVADLATAELQEPQ